MMNDLKKLERVCLNLENENKGFGARMDFWCCQTCGHAAMDNHGTEDYIFAHEQSMERAFEIKYETRYYDEFGNDCEGTDEYQESEEVEISQSKELATGGIYFHHHITNNALKRKVVAAFNDAGFLVEWDLSDESALKVLDAK
jgi:hypothetical protein